MNLAILLLAAHFIGDWLAQRIIEFIERNFDLTQKTGGYYVD